MVEVKIPKCSECRHRREKITRYCGKKIYCHRVLHSEYRQIDSIGYYPLVESVSEDGNVWAIGTCSFYEPIQS